MKWKGIKRDSIDIGGMDEGLLAINTRFKVDGELRRRRGLARTSIQKKAAGVTTISGFSAFQSNTMAALTDGDRIQGYQQPYSLWGDNPDTTALTMPDFYIDGTVNAPPFISNLGTDGQWNLIFPSTYYVSSSSSGIIFNNSGGTFGTILGATRSNSTSITSFDTTHTFKFDALRSTIGFRINLGDFEIIVGSYTGSGALWFWNNVTGTQTNWTFDNTVLTSDCTMRLTYSKSGSNITITGYINGTQVGTATYASSSLRVTTLAYSSLSTSGGSHSGTIYSVSMDYA